MFLSSLFASLLLLSADSNTIIHQQKNHQSNFSQLVWSDEFNVDGAPDSTKWSYDLGNNGWGNYEEQYYTNRTNNAIVQKGVLKIIAQKENYENAKYTSARLHSYKKFMFQYGKVEVRAKVPMGVGTWPAVWMLGETFHPKSKWPQCGEIDILEHVGRQQNKVYGTLHYPERYGDNGNGLTTMIPTASTEFHLYQLEWSPKTITISVDNVPFFTFKNKKKFPFNHNFFLLMNMALGGHFGQTIDPNFTSATLEIDYIRVYQ